MNSIIPLHGKSFTTELTAVGLLPGMYPAVSSAIATSFKGFPTEVTAVGLLSCVDLTMRS